LDDARGVVCNLHLRAWNGSPTLVRHGSVDATAEVLCSGEGGAKKHNQQQSEQGETSIAEIAG
jgi:hypothetical protein